jgi:hypothetical protein
MINCQVSENPKTGQTGSQKLVPYEVVDGAALGLRLAHVFGCSFGCVCTALCWAWKMISAKCLKLLFHQA